MSIQLPTNIAIEDFETFLARPENADKRFEFIAGQIVEVPSNPFVSEIAGLIIFFLRLFLPEHSIMGHIMGADGDYIINGQVFAPDVAFIRHLPTNQGFEEQPPLLAIEVISDPTSSPEQTDLRRKLVHYRAADVTTWVVDYMTRLGEVHLPDGSMQICEEYMTLPGSDLLPGFASL